MDFNGIGCDIADWIHLVGLLHFTAMDIEFS
jgi:hypothetical protein